MSDEPSPIFTIGHSNHPFEKFLELLQAYRIETLADIRTMPRSRHNPQYNLEALGEALEKNGIAYHHLKHLGGLRHARADSPNTGWHNASFRGYADYMQTSEFKEALEELIALGKSSRAVMMCAESVPWRCHRSMVADALAVRHIPVIHILSGSNARPHTLTEFAQVEGVDITYPPKQSALGL